MSTIIDELSWRGLIAQSTDLEALRAATSAGSICSTRGLHSI